MSLPVHLIETEFWRQIVNSTRGVTSQMSHLNRPFDVSVLPQVDMCAQVLSSISLSPSDGIQQ